MWSTGPHLHLTTQKDGKVFAPVMLLNLTELSLLGEVIEVKGSYHSFQSFGKLKDNGFFGRANP